MAEHVVVPFAGEGSGTGELTWGQQAVWLTIVEDGESKTLGGVVPLPAGATVERVAGRLSYLVGRHQSLRTRLLVAPDGTARQVVDGSGELPLEVVDAPDGVPPAEVADQVRRRYQDVPYDYGREYPVRMAVVRQHGAPTHAVAVYLQTALDAHGMAVLARDLLAHASGGPVPPMTAVQPLELARLQGTPAMQRHGRASIRHMESVLRQVALRRFPEPAQPGPPEFDGVRLASPALALAAAAVAARRGIDTSPVLLGAYAVALTRVTGVNPMVVLVPVSNRFRPRFADSVSSLAQVAPCVIDVADVGLEQVVGRAWHASMTAYKHAYYDPRERIELVERVAADRGERVDTSCYFNDRRGQGMRVDAAGAAPATAADAGPLPGPDELPDRIRAALPRSRLWWELPPSGPRQKAYLNVDDVPGAIELTLMVDLCYLPRETAEAVVRDIEAVAVEMALDPGAPTGVSAARAGVR